MGQIKDDFLLSDEEYAELLDSIENEDEDLVEAENNSDEDLCDIIEASNRVKPNVSQDKLFETAEAHRARIRVIQQRAFNQHIIDLNDSISKEHAQMIVLALTDKIQALINKYEDFVVKRVNTLLAARIPRQLKNSYKAYPNAFIKNIGFLYTTSEYIKPIYTFFVRLDIPYYFEQGTEKMVLQNYCAPYIQKIDDVIFKIENYKIRKNEAAVSYAMKIAQLPKRTYAELLKRYPIWFDLLLNKLLNL